MTKAVSGPSIAGSSSRLVRHFPKPRIAVDSIAGAHHARRSTVTRSHLFCGLVIVGFANGISERVGDEIARNGLAIAFFNTFSVSVVVWAAAIVVIWLLLQAERQAPTRVDFSVAAAAALVFLLPVPSLSWLAIAGIAVYLAWTSPSGPMRRAAAVLGALTVPMLWARILFAAMSNTILGIDAKLVGWMVGTQSSGNTIPFADGSGVLFLEPSCSSLTNVSLALLCGVVFVKAYDRPWSASTVAATMLACAATIAINVFRIGLIGVFPDSYGVIHGTIGAMLAQWATIFAVMAIYTTRIKPDAPAHA